MPFKTYYFHHQRKFVIGRPLL